VTASGTGTQLAGSVTETSTLYILINQGFANQSSFTITIVNDLNTITPVSSSYCSAYELLLYLMAGISPKGGTNTLEIQNLQLKPQ
jgi:hypothetical protein